MRVALSEDILSSSTHAVTPIVPSDSVPKVTVPEAVTPVLERRPEEGL